MISEHLMFFIAVSLRISRPFAVMNDVRRCLCIFGHLLFDFYYCFLLESIWRNNRNHESCVCECVVWCMCVGDLFMYSAYNIVYLYDVCIHAECWYTPHCYLFVSHSQSFLICMVFPFDCSLAMNLRHDQYNQIMMRIKWAPYKLLTKVYIVPYWIVHVIETFAQILSIVLNGFCGNFDSIECVHVVLCAL